MNHDDRGGDRRPDPAELELARRLRELPESIEPGRDLWPEIARQLDAGGRESHPSRQSSWHGLAAAVALMAVSSITTLWWTDRPPASVLALADAQLLSRYDVPGTAVLQARASLAIDVETRLARLAPDTRARIRDNLAQIQRALEEISVALARDPDNVLLQQLLLATYQQQLNVLTDLTQVIEDASKTRIET